MKPKTLLWVVFLCNLFFFFTPVSYAAYRDEVPNFDGILIDHDETWQKESEHVLDKEVRLVDGAKLTIEPGTHIVFQSEVDGVTPFEILDGSVEALGTSTLPIFFERASSEDAFYIDFGDWTERQSIFREVRIVGGGYLFDNGGPQTSFRNLFIRQALAAEEDGIAALNFWGGRLTIEDSVFSDSVYADVWTYDSRFEDWTDYAGTLWPDPSWLHIKRSDFSGEINVPALRVEDDACADAVSSCPRKITFENDWYNSSDGPRALGNPGGTGKAIFGTINLTGWSATKNICTEQCYSNVLFLPGIMGSRLYETEGGDEKELWYSSLDGYQEHLSMDGNGMSQYDVYTKDDTQRGNEFDETGIVDDIYGSSLYESFLKDLRDWKVEGVFADYAFIPYDWRLSPEQVVMNGKAEDGRLRYTTENDDFTQSYLYQKARDLERSSKSGKLTLIGHSNGGLVIKAFVQKLQETNDPLYHQIDKIILVGVPQTGTPDSVVSMLYGSRLGIAWLGVSAERSRSLVQNMSSMYQLLPSEKLFNAINPPIEFKGNNLDPAWTERYGDKIDTYAELKDFLTGKEVRERPDYADIKKPEVLSETFLNQAEANHAVWDNWVPAAETEVTQIAGWGLYTVSGLEVTDHKLCQFDASQLIDGRPVCHDNRISTVTVKDKLTLNGDATVIIPSALAMGESGKVKKYWVDLFRYNDDEEYFFTEKKHKNILEMETIRPFVKSLIENSGGDFQYISNFEPANVPGLKYVKYEVHSPLHLTVTDAEGNKAGWNSETDSIVENIKGAQYFEIGEVKMLLVPEEVIHTVKLAAYEPGSFTLNIDKLDGEDVVSETKFEAIPVLADSTVNVIPATVSEPVRMDIDFDADGSLDTQLEAVPGETSEYENPVEQDIVAPEIVVSFDQVTKDVIWKATDNQDTNPSLVVTVAEVTAIDKAGNTTVIPFTKYRENNTKLKVQFEKAVYNDEEVIIPKTTLIYDWKLKRDVLIDLDTELRLKNKSRLKAEYRKQKNETKIVEKDKEEKTKTVTAKPGFVSVSVETKAGDITWGY